MRKKLIDFRKCRPFVEQLEPRLLLDGGGIFHPMIVAGDPAGSPADSPADRVTAGYDAVGSVFVGKVRGFICTGTVISTEDPATGAQTTSEEYVLTAGHCVDKDDNGSVDYDPKNITFYPDGDTSKGIKAVEVFQQPDFGGFNNPAGVVNDDLFIFKLAAPAGVTPIPIHADPVSTRDVLTLVGFGRSGDGINGYTVDASLSVKREGWNVVDSFAFDDEGTGSKEIYLADFDAPGTFGTAGGSLGNAIETTVGGGDSGGPGLVNCDTTGCELAAVNTFTEGSNAPLFGSGLGGILVDAYSAWIDGVLLGEVSGNTGGKGGGGGGGGRPGGGGGRPNNGAVVAANQRLVADETGLNSFRNDIFGRSALSQDHGSGSKATENDLVREESPRLVVLRPRSANIYAISANHKAEENGDKRSIEDVDLVFTELGELDSLTFVQGFVWMRS